MLKPTPSNAVVGLYFPAEIDTLRLIVVSLVPCPFPSLRLPCVTEVRRHQRRKSKNEKTKNGANSAKNKLYFHIE
jgi:hypothetical protein